MMDFTDFDRMFSAYQKNVDQVGFTKLLKQCFYMVVLYQGELLD